MIMKRLESKNELKNVSILNRAKSELSASLCRCTNLSRFIDLCQEVITMSASIVFGSWHI